MLTHPQHPRSPDMQRSSDMTPWTVRFGLSLTVAFAATGATAVAQNDHGQEIRIQTGLVQVTRPDSDDGIPTEQFKVQRVVSYADLDLSSASGVANLNRRVSEAANQACRELISADPIDLADVDGNLSCVKDAIDGAMEQVHTAITTAKIDGRRPTRVSLK
jgi:UrcA family protein